ncbi:MAG TPA: peptidoglycan editing factor PgeF [Burkholderiaceae bacterium]|nr:peptidoglycan editing factor PgeF [Burkholderiaceae bacterium]HNG79019.1 peptidoglycan editing factor PgeF [Burkholderiaceae bacterium]
MADWLWPVFTAPGVRAVMTSRQGGVGVGPFDGLNLRPGIGDDPSAVAENRRCLTERLGVPSRRVDQVHGAAVHGFEDLVDAADGAADDGLPVADASVTARVGLACEVQVADCLPVLFADRDGRAVGAAHAGWRGLAAGVLEATLQRVCDLAGQPPEAIEAWLGACIGPAQFEVGADVVAAFGADASAPGAARFVARPSASTDAAPKWLADLPGLARDRLAAAGVGRIFGNDGSAGWCTVTNPARFFSYRRDRHTGRMAALIWRLA